MFSQIDSNLIVTGVIGCIALIIFIHVGRMALACHRAGKRAAALIFLAYDLVMLAAMLAVAGLVFLSHHIMDAPLNWLIAMCLLYGCFRLLVFLRDGEGEDVPAAPTDRGTDFSAMDSLDTPLTKNVWWDDPMYNNLPGNLWNTRPR